MMQELEEVVERLLIRSELIEETRDSDQVEVVKVLQKLERRMPLQHKSEFRRSFSGNPAGQELFNRSKTLTIYASNLRKWDKKESALAHTIIQNYHAELMLKNEMNLAGFFQKEFDLFVRTIMACSFAAEGYLNFARTVSADRERLRYDAFNRALLHAEEAVERSKIMPKGGHPLHLLLCGHAEAGIANVLHDNDRLRAISYRESAREHYGEVIGRKGSIPTPDDIRAAADNCRILAEMTNMDDARREADMLYALAARKQ